MESTGMSDRSARRLALGLGVLVLALWSSALAPGGPSYDDLEGVAANPLVNGERSPLAALTTDYWHHRGDAGHLRPLALWSLALDHRLFGAWWPGFHLTGLLWNAAVVVAGCLVVAALGRRLGIASEVRRAGMVGLALAMCHPLLADSMAWVSGRTSPMSVLPGLLACLVLLRLPAGRQVFTIIPASVAGITAAECRAPSSARRALGPTRWPLALWRSR